MTECVESALVDFYAELSAPTSGTALACVGSLARRELGPRSDVDLVLLHDGRDPAATDRLATSLWYPLWDSGVKLDHSVRTEWSSRTPLSHRGYQSASASALT